MLLSELFCEDHETELIENFLNEAAVMAWGKSGNNVVKKYRCLAGQRKNRLVKSPGDCSKRIDPLKKMRMKRLMAKMGKRIARKAKRTKRTNATSRKIKARNKAMR